MDVFISYADACKREIDYLEREDQKRIEETQKCGSGKMFYYCWK